MLTLTIKSIKIMTTCHNILLQGGNIYDKEHFLSSSAGKEKQNY